MDFSKKVIGESRAYGIKMSEMAMADLMAIGWNQMDAFMATYGANPAYTDNWHRKRMRDILEKEDFQKYLAARTEKLRKKQKVEKTEENKEDTMSKDEVATELIRTFRSLPVEDPKRADILVKYADLMQMKKTEEVADDNTIHFFLPISCKQCELWIDHQKKGKKKGGNTQ